MCNAQFCKYRKLLYMQQITFWYLYVDKIFKSVPFKSHWVLWKDHIIFRVLFLWIIISILAEVTKPCISKKWNVQESILKNHHNCQFTSEVITPYSSNWITLLLLLCTSAPLVLCCDWFDCGSRQVKRDPVDLVTVNYDIKLHWRIQDYSLCIVIRFQ